MIPPPPDEAAAAAAAAPSVSFALEAAVEVAERGAAFLSVLSSLRAANLIATDSEMDTVEGGGDDDDGGVVVFNCCEWARRMFSSDLCCRLGILASMPIAVDDDDDANAIELLLQSNNEDGD